MNAIVQTGYGSADVMEYRQVDKPVPGEGEVLVRVMAASLAAGEYFGMRGRPFPIRFYIGFPRPKPGFVQGIAFAGVVESVGDGVSDFRPGDEVYGECRGSCAEFAVAKAGSIARKPRNLTFEQAAAVPTSACTALQALRDHGKVRPGHKVLINGASGGVGPFAVQIAKALGAEVTGVCSTPERRDDPLHRRRSRHRLRAGGLHEGRAALRRDPGQRREPLAVTRRGARSSPTGCSSRAAVTPAWAG